MYSGRRASELARRAHGRRTMTLTYLCARASYLHLDLTRLPGAHRFWSTLRRGVGPVVAARMGPDRVELVVPGAPDAATRRRVDLDRPNDARAAH